jgi:hypothetical protein
MYFVPDWSSLGTAGVQALLGEIDGAFNWNSWPLGDANVTANDDDAWLTMLGSKSYMMGASPWFYTNLPQWDKNWLWKSDSLWIDRWNQILELSPTFVEIQTWNDYGESHYIGPIHSSGIPTGANRYIDNMPHDSWRDILPAYISAFKAGSKTLPAPSTESLTFWYRLSPAAVGNNDGTLANAPYQPQVAPEAVVSDSIFVVAAVASPAQVTVQIGSNAPTTLQAPEAGVNLLSVPFNGQTGNVTFAIVRDGATVVQAEGAAISDSAPDGLTNFNAWTGSSIPVNTTSTPSKRTMRHGKRL